MDFSHIVTLALALVIGTVGEVIKSLVRANPGDTGWRGVYYVTYRAHALLAGGIAGFLLHGSVAIPEEFGTGLGGYILWGSGTGGAAMVGYTVTVGMIRARIKQLGERS